MATDTARAPGLDLLRAIAIAWVMLFHSYLVGGLGPDYAWLSRFGWAGVDIFFVLSGFLIGTQVLQHLGRATFSFAAFYARRAWRIVPAFAVVLVLYASLPSMREAPGMQPWWQFATFTVNLLIDYNLNQAFSHAWSLCVEEHFYLVFPLLAWQLSRTANPSRFFAATCLALLLLGIALRAAVWLHDAALQPQRNWFIEDIYYPTWMRLDGLLVGVVLAVLRVHRPGVWQRMQLQAASFFFLGLLVCAASLVLFRERTGLLANTLGWPLLSLGFGLLVFAFAEPTSAVGRWRLPGAGWIATISYSLYLSHKMAYHLVESMLAPSLGLQGVLLFATYALAALASGALLHYLVERPFLSWRDRRCRPRPTTRMAEPV